MKGDTMQVVVSPSRSDGTLSNLAIGDQVVVEGTTSLSPTGLTVFAGSNGIDVASRASFTMSVEFLCSHWQLFEYDRFNVTGSVIFDEGEDLWWLSAPYGECRIRVTPCAAMQLLDDSSTVQIDCTLMVDLRTMTISLKVWAVTSL
jgi:hypothetical protein